MQKQRLEAFSDGVIAIIITIMVLEFEMPEGAHWRDLGSLVHVFGGYVLSFIYVAIYWNNHHHLFQVVERINGRILWANIHWLFWLSLIPAANAWVGRAGLQTAPVMTYGVILLATAFAYVLLTRTLVMHHGTGSRLAASIGNDRKGRVSVALYLAAIGASLALPWLGCLIYAIVAAIWLLPDQRIERGLRDEIKGDTK